MKHTTARRIPGFGFTGVMEAPVSLAGLSGAPIVDTNGLLVGIVSGDSGLNLRTPRGSVRGFTGHFVSELMPVLKEAVAQKGAPLLVPIKAVWVPVKVSTNAPVEIHLNTI
jgi:hypothetical protein